jgi:hypothetical protein
MITWKEGADLSRLAGKPVRFRFYVRLAELYSFWASPDQSGASNGYLGAGAPGHAGLLDVEGKAVVTPQ